MIISSLTGLTQINSNSFLSYQERSNNDGITNSSLLDKIYDNSKPSINDILDNESIKITSFYQNYIPDIDEFLSDTTKGFYLLNSEPKWVAH